MSQGLKSLIQPVREMPVEIVAAGGPEGFLEREWLITNGLGGYSCGTLAGPSTRRYHGLLIAALPGRSGRRMLLNHLLEQLRLPDRTTVHFGGEEKAGDQRHFHGADYLKAFRLEAGIPVWVYEVNGFAFERRVYMAHMQNTVYIAYRVLQGDGVARLKLRPALHFRSHDAPVSEIHHEPYTLKAVEDRFEISAPEEPAALRLHLVGSHGAFTVDGKVLPDILYRVEESRGYESRGSLWSPGHFRVDLSVNAPATLTGSTENWERMLALRPEQALEAELGRRRRLAALADPRTHDAFPSELVLAADQFIITPVGRVEDAVRVRAAGDELRSVIAGYHWFTDWGRDTMISLEGLTLVTGRHVEAGYILRTFGHYIRDGLIPNLFPEGEREGQYHTADATLWYFHALSRYLRYTGDRDTLSVLLPKLEDVVQHHLRGTRFGIGVDPSDGLLRQGAEGYQLTWMDAKVGTWVVTPRRGKAVEINALWYNALRLLQEWVLETRGASAAQQYRELAEHVQQSFNRRFWYSEGKYLYDVVDGPHGNDPACRPNQIFAFSLRHPVLDRERWAAVFDVVTTRLLTPVGLRSLAPGSPEYKPKYYGDLRSRDAAYHQGTVWPWLIGAYVDAWLKLHPAEVSAGRKLLTAFEAHLGEACVGSISEIFDAEPPYSPRGCVAQAWSVAEVLRSWVRTDVRNEMTAGASPIDDR